MSEEKVKLILKIEELDESNDAFELALFEIKNWLKTKPLLQLTAKSKLKSLEELKTIEHFFAESKKEAIFESFPKEKVEQFTITQWWKSVQSFQTNWYKQVFDATSPSDLIGLISFYFYQKNIFCEIIQLQEIISDEVVFGVESDWMVLEQGFQKVEKLGFNLFKDIQKNEKHFDQKFLLELKRLSLLPKYLKNQD
jgi:hypothetical protein